MATAPPALLASKNVIGPSPCESCPASMYTADGVTCTPCPANSTGFGAFCSCEDGFYQPTPCIPCPPGTFRMQPLTTCTQCQPGSFTTVSGSNLCLPCSPGFYSSSYGASVCRPCGAGQIQPNFGSTACFLCAIGEEPDAFKTGCVPCGAGREPAAPGVCGRCLEGFVGTGQTCRMCEIGTYADDQATACLTCPAGRFAVAGVCRECGLGRFSQASRSSTCETCAPGMTTLSIVSTSRSQCVNCGRGFYWTATESCQKCPPNTDSPPASQKLKDCLSLPGYYGLPGNPAAQCLSNNYCPAGAMAPVPCPAGKTSDPGASTCSIPVQTRTDNLLDLFPIAVACVVVCAIVFFVLYMPKRQAPKREIKLKIRL